MNCTLKEEWESSLVGGCEGGINRRGVQRKDGGTRKGFSKHREPLRVYGQFSKLQVNQNVRSRG